MPPGAWENEHSHTALGDWWAVSSSRRGIVAYFGSESDANRWRLLCVNLTLNPVAV